jgi:O-antigen ligase
MVAHGTIRQNLVEAPFSLLLFLLPLAYWPTLYEAASLPRYFLICLLGSISLFFWGIVRDSLTFKWHPVAGIILFFLVWAAISTIWSPDPGSSLIDIIQLASMIVLAFLAMQLANKQTCLHFLIPAILVGAGVAALIGIGQFFGFNPFDFRLNTKIAASTFINRNHAANYFDFIPALGFVAVLLYRGYKSWIATGVLGLVIAYLFINKSRGSLLALLVSFIVLTIVLLQNQALRSFLVSRLLERKRKFLFALFIPFVVLSAPIIFGIQSSDSLNYSNIQFLSHKVDKSSSLRLAMYINSLPVLVDHPITGLGYGGIRVGFQKYNSAILPLDFRTEETVLNEIHNDPLQYFVELGLPGGLLALALFYLLLNSGWKSFKNTSSYSSDETYQLLILGLWLALITTITHSLVDFPLRLPSSAAMFWVVAGLILGLTYTKTIQPTKFNFQIKRVLAISIGSLGLIISLFFYKPYLVSNHDVYLAAYNLQKNRCLPAAAASQNGLNTFPFDFTLRRFQAEIYTACSFSPEKKFDVMNRILESDPSITRARLTRAILLNDINRPDLAIPELMEVTKILPHRPTAYAALGDATRLQGDLKKAKFYYQAALKRKPDYNYVINRLLLLDQVKSENSN